MSKTFAPRKIERLDAHQKAFAIIPLLVFPSFRLTEFDVNLPLYPIT